ncbi:unnamed protein product [Toxocara canis]|uniref:DUF223 domain-containing protein n=1 Tax=Toxocara canis TaxID=6265 RepID=A0A183U9V3_TOXCA|nr:unnamed protein product [Toxocara canis]
MSRNASNVHKMRTEFQVNHNLAAHVTRIWTVNTRDRFVYVDVADVIHTISN